MGHPNEPDGCRNPADRLDFYDDDAPDAEAELAEANRRAADQAFRAEWAWAELARIVSARRLGELKQIYRADVARIKDEANRAKLTAPLRRAAAERGGT